MARAPGFVLAAALALGLAAVPGRSDACGNAVLATDKVVAAIKEAEQSLNDGDPAQARNLLWETVKDADELEPDTPVNQGLSNRIRRIRALAAIRLDPDGHGGEYRKVVLVNAVDTLRAFVKEAPNDAAKLTDLGEALTKTKPADARKILEDLAARDVLATPYGWTALARLRAQGGDDAGRDAAMGKCRTMAKVEKICTLEAPALPK